MRKTHTTIVTITLALCFAKTTSFAADPVCGDVDRSGELATSDALAVLRASVGQPVVLYCPAPASPLKTGQNSCFNSTGAQIDCVNTGEDGEDQAGISHSFTDNGDGTITDHSTGLMWEKLDDSNPNNIHDKDTDYTWFDVFAVKIPGLNAANFAGHDDWRLPNVLELTTLENLGADDPAAYVSFKSCSPGCTVSTCSCTASRLYWTSTSSVALPEKAWVVDFRSAARSALSQATKFPARLVRLGALRTPAECGDVNQSGSLTTSDALALLRAAVGQEAPLSCSPPASTPKTGQTFCYNQVGGQIDCAGTAEDGDVQAGVARGFIDNGDGTITDPATGLMWEKLDDSNLGSSVDVHDKDNTYTLADAIAVKVEGLNDANFAGHENWRLPNHFELTTLVNFGATAPATYGVFNSNCAPGCTATTCSCTAGSDYWTSSTNLGLTNTQWILDFSTGIMGYSSKTGLFHVRAVRTVR